jgi:hypothetical protein
MSALCPKADVVDREVARPECSRSALRKESSAVYQEVYRFWLTDFRRIQAIREGPVRQIAGPLSAKSSG